MSETSNEKIQDQTTAETKSDSSTNYENKTEDICNRVSVLQWKSSQIEDFEKIVQVGQGTFGKVYKAKYNGKNVYIHNNEYLALKKILTENEKEGFPITALREIMLLKRLKNENIIELLDIITGKPTEKNKYKGEVYLVFDYMNHDLSGLLERHVTFSIPQVKYIIHSILNGLVYLHNNNIIHRDIKSSNILINSKGEIKIADFGLARSFNPYNKIQYFTNRVVTLWYRAPELLLGSIKYDVSIDMWSLG